MSAARSGGSLPERSAVKRAKKTISIVTPCYNEEGNIRLCHDSVAELFASSGPLRHYRREHLFADNASTDATPALLRELAEKDASVRVIFNSRNFGAMPSMFNAIRAASGDAVVLFLPADLQDPPELIPEFVRLWESGFDVAYGVRVRRSEGPLMRLLRWAHYRIVNALAEVNLPPGMGEFILADRKVVDVLSSFDDFFPYVRGMVALCGFNSRGIEYTWGRRKFGKSKANWGTLFNLSFNAIAYFSRLPLRLCLWLGTLVALGSMGFGAVSVVLVLHKLLNGQPLPVPGMPTVVIGGAFLFGLNFLFLGIMGEYIGAIHSQVRRGPLVIERERLNFGARTGRGR
jgi:glycosyltransferase involved in cell wall biosynthesis